MNACLMLTLSLAALIFPWWEQIGAQEIERHTKSSEATQQILWQSIGELPVYRLALPSTSVLAKWPESLL